MTNKNSKTAFQIILGSILLVSIAVTGCNGDSSATKEVKTDTVATEKMQSTPAPMDTTPKMDTAATKPVIKTN